MRVRCGAASEVALDISRGVVTLGAANSTEALEILRSIRFDRACLPA